MAYLFALLSAACYGFNIFFIRAGSKSGNLSSKLILIINLSAGAIFLSIFAVYDFINSGLSEHNWIGFLFFIAGGICGPLLGRMFSIISIKSIGGTRTSTLRMSETFVTIVLAGILFNESISLIALTGIIILILGIVILMNETKKTEQFNEQGKTVALNGIKEIEEISNKNLYRKYRFKYTSVFVAAFFFAIGRIFYKYGLNYIPNPLLASLCGTITALSVNGIMVIVSGELRGRNKLSRREMGLFVLSGLSNSTGLLLILTAINRGGLLSIITALKNTSVIFTLFMSWLFLRKFERINVKLIVSIVVILLGAQLILFS